ncbi:hypothetical protein A1L58_20885 [Shewanella baltica]|uniref:MFS transporter n=1 Tax=Shewanella baltica TaxID=62322 RepID=UPI0007B4923D|nr:MFS transporter [Shewanella baltica]KZK67059.1 hypothetical protein A1L58_20885 [Shewanella baltica]
MEMQSGLGKDFWIYRFGKETFTFFYSALMIGISVWVLKEHDSAVELAMILGPMQVVSLITLPLLGPLVDKLSKKRLLLWSEALSIFPLFTVCLLYFSEELSTTSLAISMVVFQVCRSLYVATAAVILPCIVNIGQIPNATAKIQGIDAFVAIAGGAIGGIIVAAISFGYLVLLVIFALVLSAITIAFINVNETCVTANSNDSSSKLNQWLSDFILGFKYLYGKRVLLSMSAVLGGITLFLGPLALMLEFMVIKELELDAKHIGYLFSVLAIGNLAAMFCYSHLSSRINQPIFTILFISLIGVVLILMGLSHNYWLVLSLLLVIGFANGTVVITLNSLLLTSISEAYRGRVINLILTTIGILSPLSITVAALLLESYSSFQLFIISGVGVMCIGTFIYLMPAFKSFLKQNPARSSVWLRRVYRRKNVYESEEVNNPLSY